MFSIEFVFVFLCATYASIVYEIAYLPVPSVASTYQLFFVNSVDPTIIQQKKTRLLQRVRHLSWLNKVILLFLPTALSVLNYLFPLIYIFFPGPVNSAIGVHIFDHVLVNVIAVMLIVAGRIVSLRSVINIRKNNSQKNTDFDLKTHGFFGFSRNPILIGMYITYWGIFLLVPNWVTLIGFFIYAANMHFRILLEEDFLEDQFPGKFLAYRNNTRRYL